MKQTLFMAALTVVGVFGALFIEPFVGVAMYYFFSVLRPQYIWQWALPEAIGWSEFVAWAAIAATLWFVLTSPLAGQRPRFSGAHTAFLLFGVWICITYVTAQNQDVAWGWFLIYLKLFVMFAVATFAIRQVRQVWWIYLASTVALIYIAYELNFLYFTERRVDIYEYGYGGLDNNGAALMLAMGVPLAIHAWEATTRLWRWAFLAGVPLIIHAVLMLYSRGAMLALIVAVPLLIIRSRKKLQFALPLVLLLALVPFLAGKEIRQRFFTLEQYETDSSANSRFESWSAAVKIANEYPIFGVGIRNANLFSKEFGADMEGRSIHSQYLQTLADAGYPGLALYLLSLGSTFVGISRTRRVLKQRNSPDSAIAHSMLNGMEGALVVFCIGALFLSLEVFELPYVILSLAAQVSLLARLRAVEASPDAMAPVPSLIVARHRA